MSHYSIEGHLTSMQCVHFPRTSPPYFTFNWVPPRRRSWQLMHTKVFIDTHNHNQPLQSYAHFSTLPLPCPHIHHFSTLSSMGGFPNSYEDLPPTTSTCFPPLTFALSSCTPSTSQTKILPITGTSKPKLKNAPPLQSP